MKYRKQFKGKVVYLPCDDPAEKKSEFWSFFVNNFDAFGLKKVIATHYDENGKAYKIWIDGDTTGNGFVAMRLLILIRMAKLNTGVGLP